MKSPAEAGLVGQMRLRKILWYPNTLPFRDLQQALDSARAEQGSQC